MLNITHSLVSSLYLHFPFCLHLCNYCDFFRTKSSKELPQLNDYFNYLNQGLDIHQQLLLHNSFVIDKLETLYIGGGTPSLWGKAGPPFLNNFFYKQNILLKDQGEFTLEVNPKAWDPESITLWKSFGINRFSIGVQAFDQNLIKYLDRFHTLDDTVDTLNYFKQINANFSIDLMLGIPYSKEHKRNITMELEQLLSFNPKHFSIYILTTKSNYKYLNQIPEEDYIKEEYLATSNFLRSKGYIHYEVSNYALKGFESKHNQKYWNLNSVIAYGPSATGFLFKNYEQAIRYKWDSQRPIFNIENLGKKELRMEEIYLKLRTNYGINLKQYNINPQNFEIFINFLIENRYSSIDLINTNNLKLNSLGYLFMDSVMNQLFSFNELWD